VDVKHRHAKLRQGFLLRRIKLIRNNEVEMVECM